MSGPGRCGLSEGRGAGRRRRGCVEPRPVEPESRRTTSERPCEPSSRVPSETASALLLEGLHGPLNESGAVWSVMPAESSTSWVLPRSEATCKMPIETLVEVSIEGGRLDVR